MKNEFETPTPEERPTTPPESIEELTPVEVGPKIDELDAFLRSGEAQAILTSLREKGAEQNPQLLEYVTRESQRIDSIGDGHASQRARALLDIKQALLIDFGGNEGYAENIIRDIGETAQSHTKDEVVEDYASAALEILGF